MEPVFVDKAVMPTEEMLKNTLGGSYRVLTSLKERSDEYGDITYEWKMYSKKSGWTQLVKQKKRTLFYILPRENYFEVSFVFGDRAVEALEASELADNLKKELREARKYMEGRGISISLQADSNLKDVLLLLKAKVEI
ncbi:DUF3788 family protein [Breznakia pachnodae]|uniref:DUF3788 family protein n=1 Tax=Breznakia pachnodae TaxID=265178 RepID=A0ABU0DYH2_9FIRM|nr:DUF3788 family protein [Breznakia pachnodae]MDQ0359684.1 hypothetical protein [Breznakia pachnodae]